MINTYIYQLGSKKSIPTKGNLGVVRGELELSSVAETLTEVWDWPKYSKNKTDKKGKFFFFHRTLGAFELLYIFNPKYPYRAISGRYWETYKEHRNYIENFFLVL